MANRAEMSAQELALRPLLVLGLILATLIAADALIGVSVHLLA